MKDPADILQKGYFSTLNGSITQDGDAVGVYDHVPDGSVSYPYIRFVNCITVDDGNKSDDGAICTMTIPVVSKFANNFGGKLKVNQISDSVTQLIRTRPSGYIDLTSDGFTMLTSTLENATINEYAVEGGRIVEKILTFKHIIAEN